VIVNVAGNEAQNNAEQSEFVCCQKFHFSVVKETETG
jgi:hypothetical protein